MEDTISSMSPAELVRRALTLHHDPMWAQLPRLSDALAALDSTPRLTAPWAHLERTLSAHVVSEEREIFPAILELCDGRGAGDLGALLDRAEAEHDELRTLEVALRAAAPDAGPHERELLELLDDLEPHLSLEEEALCPAVRALLAGPAAAEAAPEATSAHEAHERGPHRGPFRALASALRRRLRG